MRPANCKRPVSLRPGRARQGESTLRAEPRVWTLACDDSTRREVQSPGSQKLCPRRGQKWTQGHIEGPAGRCSRPQPPREERVGRLPGQDSLRCSRPCFPWQANSLAIAVISGEWASGCIIAQPLDPGAYDYPVCRSQPIRWPSRKGLVPGGGGSPAQSLLGFQSETEGRGRPDTVLDVQVCGRSSLLW